MAECNVVEVLGKTEAIQTTSPKEFYDELQAYIDSKEKISKSYKDQAQNSKGPKAKLATLEYWPLIKVVKIYTKSVALSTGAVIVDLPGVS